MNIYPLTQESKDQERIIMQEIVKAAGTNNKSHTRNKYIKPPTNIHMIYERQNGPPSHTIVQTCEP
jgi:hypothetical protein